MKDDQSIIHTNFSIIYSLIELLSEAEVKPPLYDVYLHLQVFEGVETIKICELFHRKDTGRLSVIFIVCVLCS